MKQCVSYHSVGNTVFVVNPAEHQTEAAVEQETAE